jgi:hypothetical protein
MEKIYGMGYTRQQIVELALRYVDEKEITDFPLPGDLFCFFHHDIAKSADREKAERWKFGGYGICLAYEIERNSKPEGKWLWFIYADLTVFPPAKQSIQLQPPHIVKGFFQNADRTSEVRIVKIGFRDGKIQSTEMAGTKSKRRGKHKESSGHPKILRFIPR